MEWDIKYCSSSNSIDQIIEKSNKLNSGIDGEHIIENNYIYWRKAFSEYKKQYLQDYPNSRQLFNYRFESENNQLENELIEIIEDPIRESSTSANKYKHDENLLDTDNKRTKK
ncbi:hypothetical protein C2G38_2168353 [Gigaspora rosea]|uniref:Uncharacterized protein n=1 Tax=Gigaspora rosea TaxID=44941 RepID=A0A397VPU3_9GLOM|nr:hypothetical protein C2G38_2168353 [Gigaspora rosea]